MAAEGWKKGFIYGFINECYQDRVLWKNHHQGRLLVVVQSHASRIF